MHDTKLVVVSDNTITDFHAPNSINYASLLIAVCAFYPDCQTNANVTLSRLR